jgi:hypothetical protein
VMPGGASAAKLPGRLARRRATGGAQCQPALGRRWAGWARGGGGAGCLILLETGKPAKGIPNPEDGRLISAAILDTKRRK